MTNYVVGVVIRFNVNRYSSSINVRWRSHLLSALVNRFCSQERALSALETFERQCGQPIALSEPSNDLFSYVTPVPDVRIRSVREKDFRGLRASQPFPNLV